LGKFHLSRTRRVNHIPLKQGGDVTAVLGILQGHKGGITIESKERKGTTFRVLLPAITSPVSAEVPTINKRHSGPVTASKILIIDDDHDIATMAKEMLETKNITAMVELNPLHGIELYRRCQSEIALVLLDWTMPEMTGDDVVDALQEINPAVRIIITSGYSEKEVTQKIGTERISAFLQKPYRTQKLLTQVQSVMK
jgi:CheY-like chemotaxis protein